MRPILAALALVALAPWPAAAEWQAKPFLGVSFGSSSTYVIPEEITKNVSLGAGVVWLGEVVGFEGEIAHAPGFFSGRLTSLETGRGESDGSVTTLTGSVVLAVPRSVARYTLRPYFVGGIGLMRVSFSDTLEAFKLTRNLTAMNLGGGATGFLTPRVGVNWEIRYFRSLAGPLEEGFSIGPEKLSFWRASMAMVFRASQY
jgi:hypothetical protein